MYHQPPTADSNQSWLVKKSLKSVKSEEKKFTGCRIKGLCPPTTCFLTICSTNKKGIFFNPGLFKQDHLDLVTFKINPISTSLVYAHFHRNHCGNVT